MRDARYLDDVRDADVTGGRPAGADTPTSRISFASRHSTAMLLGSQRVHAAPASAAELAWSPRAQTPGAVVPAWLREGTGQSAYPVPPPLTVSPREWGDAAASPTNYSFRTPKAAFGRLAALVQHVHNERMRHVDKHCRDAVERLQYLRAAVWRMSLGVRAWYSAAILTTAAGGAASTLLALSHAEFSMLAASCVVFAALFWFIFVGTRVSEACGGVLLVVARSPSPTLMVAAQRNSSLLAMMQASSWQSDCLVVYGARVELAGLAKVASITASLLAVAATQLK
jgi:hypothetical protein